MKWIDGIMAPCLEGRPVSVTPIVKLDSYTVYKMGSIVQGIQNLGARGYQIQGGVHMCGATSRYWH